MIVCVILNKRDVEAIIDESDSRFCGAKMRFFLFFSKLLFKKMQKYVKLMANLTNTSIFFLIITIYFFIFSFVSFLFIIDCERKYIEKNLRPDKGNLSGRRFDIDTKIIRIESCKESVYF